MFRRFLAGDGSLAAVESQVEVVSQTPAAGVTFRPEGGTLMLSVTAAEGVPPYLHQWFNNGLPIPGARDAQYSAVASAAAQRLYCEVSDADGGFTASDPVDLVAGAPALPSTPGLSGSRVVLYYADLAAAVEFYEHVLGLAVISRRPAQIELQLAGVCPPASGAHTAVPATCHCGKGVQRYVSVAALTRWDNLAGASTLVLSGGGWPSAAGHTPAEPKTTALALITDQLDGWLDYVQAQRLPLRGGGFDYAAVSLADRSRPHNGFVIEDPVSRPPCCSLSTAAASSAAPPGLLLLATTHCLAVAFDLTQ